MVNEGECVCVCMWRCGCCVRACVTVYRGFVMAGFATLYDTSGPSWTSKTTATPPILRNPPYVWVWRCFDRSRSHVRLRAFLGVQCGTADHVIRPLRCFGGKRRGEGLRKEQNVFLSVRLSRGSVRRVAPPTGGLLLDRSSQEISTNTVVVAAADAVRFAEGPMWVCGSR